MGYEDREYMRGGYQASGGGGFGAGFGSFLQGAPVTKRLLIALGVVYLLQILTTPDPGSLSSLIQWGNFNIAESWQVWRLFSFQFLHGGFSHLLSNVIGLFFFGGHVERTFGSRTFLGYYLLCGVAGSLFYALLVFVPGLLESSTLDTPLIGASAGVFGLLAAFYVIAPNAKILLFFVIPIQVRTFCLVYFGWQVFAVLTSQQNAGGNAGHLGGALLGFYLSKNVGARLWLTSLMDRLGGGSKRSPKGKKARRKVRTAREVHRPERSPIETTREVDRILDKISAEGIQSLTKQERETLDRARR